MMIGGMKLGANGLPEKCGALTKLDRTLPIVHQCPKSQNFLQNCYFFPKKLMRGGRGDPLGQPRHTPRPGPPPQPKLMNAQ